MHRYRRLILTIFLLPPCLAIISAASITHGPYVGAVDTSRATVWVRTDTNADVAVEYGEDPDLSLETMFTATRRAYLSHDFTVHIPLTELASGTTYYYQVRVNGQRALTAPCRFRTFPDQPVSNFSFAVFSDIVARTSLPGPAYWTAAAGEPAFVLQIGDADHRNPASVEPIDIENWRRMHRDVLGDSPVGADLAAAIAPRIPMFHIWDDHDYGANNSDGTAPWKNIATQAFLEYYPLPERPNPDGGLWYRFTYGNADIFVLDLRSQRDPLLLPDSPDKTMLDADRLDDAQTDWLLDGLQASSARWKFIITSSVWNPHSKRLDSWYCYQNEQLRMVDFVRSRQITGVIMISGDLHAGAIDDGSRSYFPELNTPPTNMHFGKCSAAYCGDWSEGVLFGFDTAGYAWVTVTTDPRSHRDVAVLQVMSEGGAVQLEHRVELFTSADITGDDYIDALDVLSLAGHLAGNLDRLPVDASVADLNGDGAVNLLDLANLRISLTQPWFYPTE
jgi:alkaline phosphatase D